MRNDIPHPAFKALAPLLDSGIDSLTIDRLNALAKDTGSPPRTDSGASIVFDAANDRASALAYESRILSIGHVATRPGNRHDIFNALCWIAFPRVKQACNALHVAHALLERGARGPVRDAVTLFDESGVIALCADPVLGEMLARRQWKTLFSECRDRAVAALQFFVCGHALYEKLIEPYAGITGRVMIVQVSASTLDCDLLERRATADAEAARLLRVLDSPALIPPLPLSGIPGWDPRNDVPEFYDNRTVFRVN